MDDRPYKIKPPKDLAQYITRVVAGETYLIFDWRKDWVYCTRCGKIEKITKQTEGYYQHNVKTHCPICGSEAIGKEARYGRKNITEYGRILWFRKYGRVTFAQLDEYQINYTVVPAKVTFWASAQYRFYKENQEYHKHVPAGWRVPEHWEKRREVKLPRPATGMWNEWKFPKYQKTVSHTSYITNVGVDLKYARLNMHRLGYDDPGNPYALIGYIANFLKYPSIEILEKAGFERIVGQRANGRKSKAINWQAKDLRKILKLNNREIREFREAGGWIGELEKYKELQKEGLHVSFSQLKHVPDYGRKEIFARLRKFVSLEKAIKYLDAQNSPAAWMRNYADYLEECDILGCDMTDKKILRPKDLQKAHELSSQKVKIEMDRRRCELFAKYQKEIYSSGQYSDGNLLIRLALSPEELSKESQELHHCVRAYGEKVARGNCAILFIRRADDPDTPYYTLELSPDKNIVQCRGLRNCGMTEEVKEFVDKWHKDIVLKKKKKGAAAPAA